MKATEDTKPNASVTTDTAAEATTDTKEESNKGNKREHGPGDADETPTESVPKKQKTDTKETEDRNGTAGTDVPTPTTNGEKKKSGRPKKIKDAVKKAIPSDGIGSRTRSRTKAT